MVIESVPKEMLPHGYRPDNSRHVWVGGSAGGKLTDTWESVAAAHRLDVKELIKFNFKTTYPPEVNFYLRTKVGCRIPSKSKLNWTFELAMPGLIYVPTRTVTVPDGHVMEGERGDKDAVKKEVGRLKEMFSSDGWTLLGKLLDIAGALDTGAAIAGLGLGMAGTIAMPAASLVALMMSLGSPHLEALNKTKLEHAIAGFSYGIVLGADKKGRDFIKAHRFDQRYVKSSVYPEQERNFLAAYQSALAAGWVVGAKKMNDAQRKELFIELQGWMDMGSYPEDVKSWGYQHWHRYYQDAMVVFRKRILKL